MYIYIYVYIYVYTCEYVYIYIYTCIIQYILNNTYLFYTVCIYVSFPSIHFGGLEVCLEVEETSSVHHVKSEFFQLRGIPTDCLELCLEGRRRWDKKLEISGDD